MIALKETMAKLQPLVDWVNSYPTVDQLKAELGLTQDYPAGHKVHSHKTMEEAVAEIERDEVNERNCFGKKDCQ